MIETSTFPRILLLSMLAACARPQPEVKKPAETPVDPGPPYGRVLAVDLTDAERSRLIDDLALGLAFVKYDGRVLSMLPGCTSRGEYGFVRFEPELSVLVLTTQRELGLNLPTRASLLERQTGGLREGATFDVASRTIGRWTATAGARPAGERCRGATHWIRSADVGVFAASVGSETQPRLADELIAAGGELKGGDVSSCGPPSSTPPPSCAQPIRLELVRIGEELRGDTLGISGPSVVPCGPEDTALVRPRQQGADFVAGPPRPRFRPADAIVRTETGCVQRDRAKSYTCDPSDEKECFEQCDRGSATSCELLGVLVSASNRPESDRTYAARLFDQACELGSSSACTNLAIAHRDGTGLVEDPERAKEIADRVCQRGHARACAVLGALLESEGHVDRSYAFFQRGCEAGSALACGRVAFRLSIGLGVKRDESRAEGFAFRACDGGDGEGCLELGYSFEFAGAGRLDENRALSFYRRACNTRSDRCRDLAIAYDSGRGIDQNQGRARELFRRACQSWDMTSCTYLQILGDPDGKVGVPKKVASAQLDQVTKACAAGRARACTREALMSLYDRKKAAPKLLGACKSGDPFACHVADLVGFVE